MKICIIHFRFYAHFCDIIDCCVDGFGSLWHWMRSCWRKRWENGFPCIWCGTADVCGHRFRQIAMIGQKSCCSYEEKRERKKSCESHGITDVFRRREFRWPMLTRISWFSIRNSLQNHENSALLACCFFFVSRFFCSESKWPIECQMCRRRH